MIEDYIPIKSISFAASQEKTPQAGYPATLHIWWARRPLIASRAAVYATLTNAPVASKRDQESLFLTELCEHPVTVDKTKLASAKRRIMESHASRLSRELGRAVTYEDIEGRNVPGPRVLDMFAGGGAIPLESARLGCETYALELNPVAHLIELCTLVYPQKYLSPNKNLRGSAEDKSWAGLANEVEYWGKIIYKRAKEEIGDLYKPVEIAAEPSESLSSETYSSLIPLAYIWSRVVTCKNQTCRADVPLLRQTWLFRKEGNFTAVRVRATKSSELSFHVVKSTKESEVGANKEFGFDPSKFSRAGNAECQVCHTVADSDYVKSEGLAGRIRYLLVAAVCAQGDSRKKVYLGRDDIAATHFAGDIELNERILKLCKDTGLTVPEEPIIDVGKRALWCVLYGLTRWKDLFTLRQLLSILTFVKNVRIAHKEMLSLGVDPEAAKGISTYLAFAVDRLCDYNSSITRWNPAPSAGLVADTFSRPGLPMMWDFAETNPFGGFTGDWMRSVQLTCKVIPNCYVDNSNIDIVRGSALQLRFPDSYFDAIVTDPPYYDNVSYANLADFFYVWLKRTIGDLYPEHFSAELTPKKNEIVSDSLRYRTGERARIVYEEMMAKAFLEARRVLKDTSPMVVVYAHKTTIGWSTLVDAMRQSGFVITEAWPLNTEKPGRLRAQNSAALASSIFLIARRRERGTSGRYETQVQPTMARIARERVETLWDEGVSGADLVIAAVGASLRAYTAFERVEYENGEAVPSERFIQEVEGLVLDVLLGKLGLPKADVAAVDNATRFYVLWSYTYGQSFVESGEAIVFSYSQGVELDGARGLSSSRGLLEKKSGKYRLKDFTERGHDEKLGVSSEDGVNPSQIDVLHRVLWLMENEPSKLSKFMNESRLNQEKLRLVANALAGSPLKGGMRELRRGSPSEMAALEKALAHWHVLIEERVTQRKEQLSLGDFSGGA